MIWVRLFPREEVEDVARRIAGILARDLLPGAPPYWQADSQKWQLDRANNWWCSAARDLPGWVTVRNRGNQEQMAALADALQHIDLREVVTDGAVLGAA